MSSGGSRSPGCWWAAGGRTGQRALILMRTRSLNLKCSRHFQQLLSLWCHIVLTGRISNVCRAPVFRVMVSLSLAVAESEALWETKERYRVKVLFELECGRKSHTRPPSGRVSPRWVICSGIWTGICSAATELEVGLPLLSSSRVSRICSEEEEGLPDPECVCEDVISSSRPFSRTGKTHATTERHWLLHLFVLWSLCGCFYLAILTVSTIIIFCNHF